MIKIGITGSLASGKTTASKILSFRRGPLFSADKAVKELPNASQRYNPFVKSLAASVKTSTTENQISLLHTITWS